MGKKSMAKIKGKPPRPKLKDRRAMWSDENEPYFTPKEVYNELSAMFEQKEREKSKCTEVFSVLFLWYEYTVRRCKTKGLQNVSNWIIEQVNYVEEDYLTFADMLKAMHDEVGLEYESFPLLRAEIEGKKENMESKNGRYRRYKADADRIAELIKGMENGVVKMKQELSCSVVDLDAIMHGYHRPTLDEAIIIARTLKKSVEELFTTMGDNNGN